MLADISILVSFHKELSAGFSFLSLPENVLFLMLEFYHYIKFFVTVFHLIFAFK